MQPHPARTHAGAFVARRNRTSTSPTDELKNIRFDALLCSDLKRCMDTAMILNEPHGLPLESTPLLRERDWGPFTGMDILKARTKIDHRAEPVESMFSPGGNIPARYSVPLQR